MPEDSIYVSKVTNGAQRHENTHVNYGQGLTVKCTFFDTGLENVLKHLPR